MMAMEYLALLIVTLTCVINAQRRNHYQNRGPNTCPLLRVYSSAARYYGEMYCLDRPVRKVCGRTAYVDYECCPGYRKVRGKRGCVGEVPLDNIFDTATKRKLGKFTEVVKEIGEVDKLKFSGPFSVFAPDDTAFHRASDHLKEQLSPGDDRTESLLKYHMLQGIFNLTTAKRESMAETMYGTEKIRINKYPFGLYTVNCARIMQPDILANNGLLSTIDRVIEPLSNNGDLAQIIMDDDKFAQFQLLLHTTDIINKLRGKTSYTVFAPTNEAFEKLPSHVSNRIFNDKKMAEALVKNHIVKRTFCSEGLITAFHLRSLEGSKLRFTCHKDGSYSVNGFRISHKDKAGTNGVVHTIDDLMIPDSVKDVEALGKDMHLDEFFNLFDLAGDTAELRGNKVFTVFAPTDEAFAALEPKYRASLRSESGLRRRVLNHHTLEGAKIRTGDLFGTTKLNTSNLNVRLKVSIFRNGVSIDNAMITEKDRECANGVIHKIDKVMIPSEDTLMEIIENDAELSTFREMIDHAGLVNLLIHDGEYTIIAPTNQAFNRLRDSEITALKQNYSKLRNWMERHVINRVIPTCGINHGTFYEIESRQGRPISLTLNSRGEYIVNDRYTLEEVDINASNGIMHKTDTLLPCGNC